MQHMRVCFSFVFVCRLFLCIITETCLKSDCRLYSTYCNLMVLKLMVMALHPYSGLKDNPVNLWKERKRGIFTDYGMVYELSKHEQVVSHIF